MVTIEIYERVITSGSNQYALCDYTPFTPPSGEGKPINIPTADGDALWQVGPLFRYAVEIPGDEVPQPLVREGKAVAPMYLTDPKDPAKKVSANEILLRLTKGEEGYRMLKCEHV